MMKLNVIQFNLALFVQCRLQPTLSPGALQKPSGSKYSRKNMQNYQRNSRKRSIWTGQQQETLRGTRLVAGSPADGPLAVKV